MAEKNIAGIHNYCDRWCERCSFTGRCAVFKEEAKSNEQLDMKNKLFFEKLSQNFTKAKSLLEEIAERSGMNLETLSSEIEKSESQRQKNRKLSREHPLSTMALSYRDLTSNWLRTQPGMMQKLEEMKADLTLGIESQERARADMQTIKDALAVIQWYHDFIPSKISRALHGKLNAQEWEDDLDDAQQDFNGTAKITMIAIDSSMAAWTKLFDLLSEQEDHFLTILGSLDRMKKDLLTEFPKCAEFVRPGFDEISARGRS